MKRVISIIMLLLMATMFVGCGVEELETTQEQSNEYWLVEIMARATNETTGNYVYNIAEYGDISTYDVEVYSRLTIESEELFSVGELVLLLEIGEEDQFILIDFEN